MADFFTGYSNVVPKQTSLSDIMNLASGVQNYQQAQQMNPLTLRKAAAETQVSEETAPTRIAQQKAETETAITGANSAKLKNAREHLDNVKRESVKLLQEDKLTRNDVIDHYKKTIKNVGGDDNAINQAIERIPQTDDTNALKTWIARDFTGALSAENQLSKLFPDVEMQDLGGKKVPIARGSQIAFVKPGTPVGPGLETTIQPQIVEVAGVKYYVQPSAKPGGQPILTPVGETEKAPATKGAPMPQGTQTAPSGVKKLVVQDMPVPSGGITQLNTYQKPRFDSGTQLIKDSVDAAQAATEGEETSRQVKSHLSAAAGSAPGQFLRKAGQWVAGDPNLEILTKNLADQQLRNMQMMGAKTDAASADVKAASGKADLTREALQGIVDRTDASNTAVKAFQKGLKQYTDQGINGIVHADKYKQAWADNYDVRIFKAMNVDRSNMSKAQKDLERQKLIKGLSDKQLKDLQEKAANIEQLERGDK